MKPYLVGAWDGTHLWLQWDSDKPAEVRFRFRQPKQEWGEWRPTIKPDKAWLVYPVPGALGMQAQAQVRCGESEEDWIMATEATFVRSTCRFEFSSQKKVVHFIEGVTFHAHVDGAVCSYRLKQEIELAAGEATLVEMEAVASSGHAQLDRVDDFLLRPALGLTIRNIEPSRNDVLATDRDFTDVRMVKRDGEFAMAFLPPRSIR